MRRNEAISKQMSDFAKYGTPNVTSLRLSQGDGFSPTDWLTDLQVGTHFIAERVKAYNPLSEYSIMGKEEKMTLLRENRREGKEDKSWWQWVDNIEFCSEYDLRKVL